MSTDDPLPAMPLWRLRRVVQLWTTVFVLLVATVPARSLAAEIVEGRIGHVAGDRVVISIGEGSPRPGDFVEVYELLQGLGLEGEVAIGEVVEVQPGQVIATVRPSAPEGRVLVGDAARIYVLGHLTATGPPSVGAGAPVTSARAGAARQESPTETKSKSAIEKEPDSTRVGVSDEEKVSEKAAAKRLEPSKQPSQAPRHDIERGGAGEVASRAAGRSLKGAPPARPGVAGAESRETQASRERGQVGREFREQRAARPPLGTYAAVVRTPVLSQARSDAAVVAYLERGKRVEVVDVAGDYGEVRSKHGRPPGYVLLSDLVFRGQTQAARPPRGGGSATGALAGRQATPEIFTPLEKGARAAKGFTRYEGRAISGHNRRGLAKPLAECRDACLAEPWCRSFDYNRDRGRGCYLSDKAPGDPGVSVYENRRYDLYVKSDDKTEREEVGKAPTGADPLASRPRDPRWTRVPWPPAIEMAHIQHNAYSWQDAASGMTITVRYTLQRYQGRNAQIAVHFWDTRTRQPVRSNLPDYSTLDGSVWTGTQPSRVDRDYPDGSLSLFVPYSAFQLPAGETTIRAQARVFVEGELVESSNALDFTLRR